MNLKNQMYATATILLCEVDNPSRFGIADVTGWDKLLKLWKNLKNPPTNLAVTGIYFLNSKNF